MVSLGGSSPAAAHGPAAPVRKALPRLGYPCMNLTLALGTGHTFRLATIGDAQKVRGVVERNLSNLERILRWNAEHAVRLFRIGSQLIPFGSHPAFPYNWRREHGARLAQLGRLARESGQRLSMHPGQYTQPGSPNAGVAERGLAELRYAAGVLEAMDAQDGVVVLHLGGAYGDKQTAAERFAEALRGEQEIRRYLALENDERTWAPHEAIEAAERIGVPAIVDTLHHRLNPGALTLREALARARATWPEGRRQKVHISSQDPAKKPGAHAPLIARQDWEELLAAAPTDDFDVMVEAKGKEQALRALGMTQIEPLPAPPATPDAC